MPGARLAALARFVATGQSDEHGLRTLAARAQRRRGSFYFVAMCDRLAQILEARGDTDPVDVRRSKALAILANPAGALALLEEARHRRAAPGRPRPVPGGGARPRQHLHLVRRAPHRPGRARPRAILHVRISELALDARAGVAAVDAGVGPVSVRGGGGPARAPPGQRSPGGRPARQRPGRRLRGAPRDAGGAAAGAAVEHPALVAHRLEASPDSDHTRSYVPGVAGQTRITNLGPLVRFGHRVKTFGRGWQLRQPTAGVYLWRTPHDYWFRGVRTTAPTRLGRDPDLTAHDSPDARSSMEHALADLVASS